MPVPFLFCVDNCHTYIASSPRLRPSWLRRASPPSAHADEGPNMSHPACRGLDLFGSHRHILFVGGVKMCLGTASFVFEFPFDYSQDLRRSSNFDLRVLESCVISWFRSAEADPSTLSFGLRSGRNISHPAYGGLDLFRFRVCVFALDRAG